MDTLNQLGLSILGLLAGMGAAFLQAWLSERRSRRNATPPATIQDRLARLTRSLREATDVIADVEREISDRTALATKLEADVARYEELAAMHREEVEAVAQALRGELRTEGRRSFWLNTAVNVALVGLGALLGAWIS